MKRKHFAFVIVIVIASSMMALGASNALTIKKSGNQKGPVTFTHAKHQKLAMELQKCKTCHHAGTRLADYCGQKGCHSDPVKDAGGKRVHAMCIDKCHKAKSAKAPTDCSDKRCHKS